MSNRARRLLAIAVCLAVGVPCLILGTQAIAGSGRLLGLVYLLVAGFFLLSAVGLMKPWLPKPELPARPLPPAGPSPMDRRATRAAPRPKE
jgi:hypothetical protein